MLVISVCGILVPAAQAQAPRGLKYVPQAVKSTKAIPYAVNPKLPLTAQLRIATPVLRPGGASLEMERALAAAIAARQEQQTRILARLETQLPELEQWAKKHHDRLPTVYSWMPNTPEEILMDQVLKDVKSLRNLGVEEHPLLDRYNVLIAKKHERKYLDALAAMNERKKRILEELPYQLFQLNQYRRENILKDGAVVWAAGSAQRVLWDQVSRDVDFLKKQFGLQDHALVKEADVKLEYVAWDQKDAATLQESLQREREAAYSRRLLWSAETLTEQEWKDLLRQRQIEKEQEKSFQEELAEAQQRALATQQFDEVTDANAIKAAQMARARIFMEGKTTQEVVEKLLAFYNQMSPFGDTFDIVSLTPAQWADRLEQFIAKNQRVPLAFNRVASQQMLDEYRLARAVSGLIHRLPEGDPNRLRIEQLLAGVLQPSK